MTISTYLSITTLNVNELNSPNKRHRLAKWIKKKKKRQDPSVCCLQEIHVRYKVHTEWKWSDGKRFFHANGHQREPE